MPSEIPWKRDTQQVVGRKDEQRAARKLGARLHSNSGAGPEKNDYSTDDTVFEHKSVAKSHTLNGADLNLLRVNAAKQGKTAKYIVYFQDENITLVGEVVHGKDPG